MIKIDFKPISVNEAYTGKRFKTEKYRSFIRAVSFFLPSNLQVPKGRFYVIYEFGLSNISADYDGPIKNFQDTLQARYQFDDKMIIGGFIHKVKVEKGQEYISFKFFSDDQKKEFIEKIQLLLNN